MPGAPSSVLAPLNPWKGEAPRQHRKAEEPKQFFIAEATPLLVWLSGKSYLPSTKYFFQPSAGGDHFYSQKRCPLTRTIDDAEILNQTI